MCSSINGGNPFQYGIGIGIDSPAHEGDVDILSSRGLGIFCAVL